MASVATEAQRLIAVSLGKIAASRSQRGGINLHKNLLVASVLHKARTAYMMENFQHLMAARKAQMVNQTANAEGENARSSVPPVSVSPTPKPCHEANAIAVNRSDVNVEPPNVRLSSRQDDKENTPPMDPQSGATMTAQIQSVAYKNEAESTARISECVMTQASRRDNGDYVSKQSSCHKCVTKRRSSEQDYESSLPKKPRMSESGDSESHSEPMQVEPPQISNLVSIFNAGFSGLCPNQTDSISDNRVGSAKDQSPVTSQTLAANFGAHRLTTGRPVRDTTSLLCSSQAMDNRVDSVPTAIALTV